MFLWSLRPLYIPEADGTRSPVLGSTTVVSGVVGVGLSMAFILGEGVGWQQLLSTLRACHFRIIKVSTITASIPLKQYLN